jgi:hypothetical protein
MYKDVCAPLEYHGGECHCPKNPLYSTCSSSPSLPQSFQLSVSHLAISISALSMSFPGLAAHFLSVLSYLFHCVNSTVYLSIHLLDILVVSKFGQLQISCRIHLYVGFCVDLRVVCLPEQTPSRVTAVSYVKLCPVLCAVSYVKLCPVL